MGSWIIGVGFPRIQVSLSTCSIFFLIGINIEEIKVRRLMTRFGCKFDVLPFSYLGLTLGGNDKLLHLLGSNPRQDKSSGKLAKCIILKGVRLTLAQSVMVNIPTIFSSLFNVPVKVGK